VLVPPEPANPASLMFGALALTKARAWLGDERLRKLQASDEAELAAQEASVRTGSSANCYRGVMVATIGAAYPDLADRAATESIAWLRSQYAALPDPNTEQDQENTDMAQDDFDYDPFAARRAVATAHARFDSQSGATSMTAAEQQAAIDEAESRFDAQIGREMYFRLARSLRGQDAQSLRTDAADSGKPKRTALQRALSRLQEIYDQAENGTLDARGAQEAAKLLDSLADLHKLAGPELDDDQATNTDASDPSAPRPQVVDPEERTRRRAQFLLTNAWRMTAEERQKVQNDWALSDFNDGPDAA
jgi:hypothetical protein